MKRFTITICTAALLFACNDAGESKSTAATDTASVTTTTSNSAKNNEPMPDSATQDRNWRAYMTPAAPHQMMASWNGTWTGEVSLWMDPSAPPMKSTMTAENKMVMGGRYQQAINQGTFMNEPFEGMSTLAYDNHKKHFISTWVDNMGTGIMVLEGPWDEASKTMTLKGKMVDPASTRDMEVKETFRIVDNDHQVMEMYHVGPDGKEVKTMEIKYTRKK